MTALRTAAQQALEALETGGWNMTTRAIADLERALAQQDEPEAYGYASRLAVAIWEKHYKDTAPQWKLLDDLMGVLTQIDNMTSGLTRLAQQAEPVEPVAWTLTKTLNKRETTTNGYLWFSDPVNSSWTPLYTAPPQCKQAEPLNLSDRAVQRRLATQWGYVPAALAEPAQEPAAWRFEARHIDTAWGPAVSLKRPGPEHKYMRNVIPLYAAPPHQKQVGWMQKSTGVIRCDWGFDTTGYVPVYAAQEQSE